MKSLAPCFKIVMLGASGAGKTLYLASLHHKLSLLNPDLGFYINTDAKKALILNSYAAALANPEAGWPAGTRNLKRWDFICYVNSFTDKIKAFEFEYIDYAGGALTDFDENDSNTAQHEELFSSIQEANILLGLLDGEKLIDFMADNDSEKLHRFMSHDLPTILYQMRHAKPNIPVHFLISKWDMVSSFGGFTIADIRNKLLTNSMIKNFLGYRENINNSIVRLIPISAIGLDRASYQRDLQSGRVITIRDTDEIDPYNVTVPLSYVLSDSIQSSVQALEAKKQSMKGLQRFLFSVRSIFRHPLLEILPSGFEWIVKMSAFTAGVIEHQNTQRFSRFFSGEIGNITKQQDALKYMLDVCRKTTFKFEDNHSGTILTITKTM
jgi:hypothetical protein